MSVQARELLTNPLLQRFFTVTEESLLSQWANTEPSQMDEREVAYHMLTLAKKFKLYFETFLVSEEYAAQQLEEAVGVGDE